MNAPNAFAITTVQHQTVQPESLQYSPNHLKTLRILGIVETMLGMLLLGIGVKLLAELHVEHTIGVGVWGGIWLILAGIFACANPPSRCMINTHMTLSIIGTVAMGAQVAWSGKLVYGSSVVEEIWEFKHTYSMELLNTIYALFLTMSIISGISFIILIVSAILCCCALPCCGKNVAPQPGHVLVSQSRTQHFPANQAAPASYPGSDYPSPGYGPL